MSCGVTQSEHIHLPLKPLTVIIYEVTIPYRALPWCEEGHTKGTHGAGKEVVYK